MAKKEERKERRTEEKPAPEDPHESLAQTAFNPEKGQRRLTLDQAVAWFAKDPHPEEFISAVAPGFALIAGKRYLKFENRKFVTDDPKIVEILLRSESCNREYFAMNPLLRNLKAQ